MGWIPVFTKLGKKVGFCAASGVATPRLHCIWRRDANVKNWVPECTGPGVATARDTRQWRRDDRAQVARVIFRVLSHFYTIFDPF